MKITDFDIKINKENVLMLIDCYPNSPIYDEVLAELEEMLPEAYEKLMPEAVFAFGDITEYDLAEYGDDIKDVLFCIETVGGKISAWVTAFFDAGNYLKGMLADAIADDCLFQIDRQLNEIVVRVCKEKGYGVLRRLEAPQDIPMCVQRTAWEMTDAKKEIGLDIKDSYMLDPVKSNCQVFILKKNYYEYKTEHDCGKCPRIDCKMRHLQSFPVTVKQGCKEFTIEGRERQTLLEILQNSGIYLSAVCAGRGICGKCKVQFLKGFSEITKEDEAFLGREELDEGYRLACRAVPNKACTILLYGESEEGFMVVSEYESTLGEFSNRSETHYGIVVDIGTTTVAMQLVELESGAVIDTYTAINRQRMYGADVISRIKSSNEGNALVLQKSILEDLNCGLEMILKNTNVQPEYMVISGNTTMIHLLMGYSCETLGVYPFVPVNIDTIETNYKELFGDEKYSFHITVIPGISTYVGGDIVAGLLACEFDQNRKISILIDLGTNGEMAIGCKDKILVASTAAGPAFEGGNIICGMGSVPGAVSHAVLKDGHFETETIGGKTPIGICGTGVIDITYELMENALIDETGLLDKEYFEDGILVASNENKDIRFYQKDVREIQLAKSAVRSGIETLLVNYGVTYEEIDTIYIAGGFGYKIDVRKAVGIGLLPKECKEKIRVVGNSSLNGGLKYISGEHAKEQVTRIISVSKEIPLSVSKEFNDFYMEYMYF